MKRKDVDIRKEIRRYKAIKSKERKTKKGIGREMRIRIENRKKEK